MKVEIYSRENIKKLIACGFPAKTAVISFHDPIDGRISAEYHPVDYKGVCERLFYVPIRDIDIDILGEYGLTEETYFPEVDHLAKFIMSAVNDGYGIICQCEYGQSRSAACAAAIKEFYDKSGIDIFADYRYYPNQLVFNKVLRSLRNNHKKQ